MLLLPLVIFPQLRVTDWPEVIEVELAVKEEITGAPAQPPEVDPEEVDPEVVVGGACVDCWDVC